MKSLKQADFKKSKHCEWRNNIIYDISTNDDRNNKALFGKWC